jgi:predicted ester cyclase
MLNDIHALKLHFHSHLATLKRAGNEERAARYAEIFAPAAKIACFHPLGGLEGRAALAESLLTPLWAAFPDLERCTDIVLTGASDDGLWTASLGHWVGTFEQPWLGIAPTGAVISLRFGEFLRWDAGRVTQGYLLFDLLDFFRQAGVYPASLFRPRGVEDRWPPPPAGLGTLRTETPPAESQFSLHLVSAMLRDLSSMDPTTLDSSQQSKFWHPEMMWFGPGGIGTSRRLKGFQDVFQRPFLEAFPDRLTERPRCRIGDGFFCAAAGWPSGSATHRGSWLGIAPTGQPVTLRAMQFWRRDESLLRECWLLFDQLDLLEKMGFDALAEARAISKLTSSSLADAVNSISEAHTPTELAPDDPSHDRV